jgi:hypothetical protein
MRGGAGVRVMMAAVAVACAAVSGCTINVGTQSGPATARVPNATLQSDLSNRAAKAGAVATSVNCPEDLVGEVGNTTRCEVTTGTTGGFELLVTVTSVAGSTVNYDVIPAVSKSQLAASVAGQIGQSSGAPVDAVVCESGLDGTPGAVAHCAVTVGGATLRRSVEVTAVSGLSMKYAVVPILLKNIAAGSLLAQLGQVGPRPDSASCADNLDGIVGNTVECTTVAGGHTQTYVLTVTTVTGSNITYRYALKP